MRVVSVVGVEWIGKNVTAARSATASRLTGNRECDVLVFKERRQQSSIGDCAAKSEDFLADCAGQGLRLNEYIGGIVHGAEG
jgi:hypothetical protein